MKCKSNPSASPPRVAKIRKTHPAHSAASRSMGREIKTALDQGEKEAIRFFSRVGDHRAVKRIRVYLPASVKECIKRAARKMKISMSGFVRLAVRFKISDFERAIDPVPGNESSTTACSHARKGVRQ
jgi:hypothetical protein